MNPESSPPSLPIEVWGQIFEKIDNPLDLMRARRVCKKWNEEINRVMPFANWKKLCLSKIRAFSLSSIVAVVQPTLTKIKYRDIKDQDFWRHVYHHYMKWLKIKTLPVNVASTKNSLLLSNQEYITCFDIWGVWIMYGTNIGRVYILEDQEEGRLRRARDFYIKIEEVKIWHYDNNKFCFLAVTQNQVIHIGYPEVTFSLRGNKLCTGTAKNLYYVQDNLIVKLEATPPTVRAAFVIGLNFNPEGEVVAMSSRESKIFVVVQAGTQLKIFSLTDESLTNQNPMFQVHFVEITPSLPVEPSNMYVYDTYNRTLICLQNEHLFIRAGINDFWMAHYEPQYFDAMVTSLIVHGNYIILGLSNGVLSMYYIEGISSLVSSQLFEKEPTKTWKLGNLPIIAIKVTDVDEEIHVTAFSQKNMFTLIF